MRRWPWSKKPNRAASAVSVGLLGNAADAELVVMASPGRGDRPDLGLTRSRLPAAKVGASPSGASCKIYQEGEPGDSSLHGPSGGKPC